MLLYLILLAVVLAIILYTTLTGRSSYQDMERAKKTEGRQKVYRSWIRESWLLFGVPSAIGLLALAYTDSVTTIDVPFPVSESTALGLAIGMSAMLFVLTIHSKWYSTRISPVKSGEMKRFITESGSGSLVAKNKKERQLASWLSVAAGINEELLFRALLPVLLINVFGIEWSILAVSISVALFGLAHAYQGISGIVVTGIIGAVFMFIYLGTGSLALVILVHILFDIRATVATSWLVYSKT